MFRLSLTLLVAFVATPAFATDQQKVVVREKVVVRDNHNQQKVQKQKQQRVIVREKVVVQDQDDYQAAVHAQNQARIRGFLGFSARQAIRNQRLREQLAFERALERERFRRNRDFILLNQSPSPFNGFGFPRRRFIPGNSFIQFGFGF